MLQELKKNITLQRNRTLSTRTVFPFSPPYSTVPWKHVQILIVLLTQRSFFPFWKKITFPASVITQKENMSKHLLIRTIEGKTYDGVVKKKEEAQQQYSQAVSRGESAGIVRYQKSPRTQLYYSSLELIWFILHFILKSCLWPDWWIRINSHYRTTSRSTDAVCFGLQLSRTDSGRV